ncbi:MAG TPA: antibiotic biosynthesis monooxygenase [Candidatus Binataceae bacterium]|nr:antibiotic biosynthesis monooxygenase [Candidatus Binataceae bacterium]
MDTPWKATIQPSPEQEYLALLSFLPLKQSRRIPGFLVYTWRIVQQLKRARGLVGYTIRAQLLNKSFWTLSAWETEAAMRAFVQAPPHREVMAALQPYMGQTSFNQWTVKGAELPLQWDDALRHQQKRGVI